CNSEIYQAASNYVGVNRTTPLVQFDVSGAINAEPISTQQNSGNFGILKSPVLGIGWPEANVVPSNGNLYVGTIAGGQGINLLDVGLYNTFVGMRAGLDNLGGTSNSFVGYQSGEANTTGDWNAFLGTGAGKANVGGTANTFLGYRSGLANTNGNDNTFLGYQSGFANTSGVSNAFLGLQAGFTNTTGGANTFLGAGACSNITTGNSDICIGYGVSAISSGTSNTILVGTEGLHTAAYVAGIYSEPVGATNSSVCIDNTGKLGTTGCPAAGTGTVTLVGSGLGLTGGPITTTGTLKIDTTVVPLLNTANT